MGKTGVEILFLHLLLGGFITVAVQNRIVANHHRFARGNSLLLKENNKMLVAHINNKKKALLPTWTEPRLVVRIVVTRTLDEEATLGPRRILLLSVVNSREMLSCDSRASSKSRWALRRWAFSRLTSSSASSSWRLRACQTRKNLCQKENKN